MSMEQQTNLKFLAGLGETTSEALELLQKEYRDEAMSQTRSRLFEWCKGFKKGREEVEDDLTSGRPSTSRTDVNIKHIMQMLQKDHQLTVQMLASLRRDPSGGCFTQYASRGKRYGMPTCGCFTVTMHWLTTL